MKKTVIIFISIFAFAFLFAVGALSSSEAGEITGKCGDDITYRFDGVDTLTVSGTGEMYEYTYDNIAPWYQYRAKIRKLELGEGITKISKRSFNYISAEKIVIPDSVVEIDEGAFTCCFSLTDLKLGKNLVYIRSDAFEECESLIKVVIPDKVEYIGKNAFAWTALESVKLGKRVKHIGENAFYSFNQITLHLPASVSELEEGAISTNTKEVTVDPENKHYKVSGGTLYSCDGKELIYVTGDGNSFTVPDGVERIWLNAFFDKHFETITLPDGLKSIGRFSGNAKLKKIVIPDSVIEMADAAFNACTGLVKVTLGKGLTKIPPYAFCECYSLSEVVFRGKVTTINECAFGDCESLKKIDLPDSLTNISFSAFEYSGLEQIKIPRNVKTVNNNAFGGSKLRKVEFAGCPETIDTYAFVGTLIEEIRLPDGLKTVSNGLFSGCRMLKTVYVPASVTRIDGGAFNNCSALRSVIIDEKNAYYMYDRYALYNKDRTRLLIYLSDETVFRIPDTVEIIDQNAFFGNKTVTEIRIPASVKSIGEYAFGACSELKTVVFEGDAPDMTNRSGMLNSAFRDDKLNVFIPENNKTWTNDKKQYYGAANIHYYSIKPGAEYFGVIVNSLLWSFDADSGELEISGSGNVSAKKTAEEMPWYGLYDSIKTVRVTASMQTLREFMFSGMKNLETVILCDDMTVIKAGAFEGCVSLKRIVMSAKTTKIEENAFKGCTELKSVYYRDSADDLCKSDFSGEYASPFSYGAVLYIGEEEKRQVVIFGTAGKINDYTFYGGGFESFTLQPGVTKIGAYAFAENKQLYIVNFLGGAPEIDETAFSGVTCIAVYPANVKSWTAEKMRDYGGNITWIPDKKITGPVETLPRETDAETVTENVTTDTSPVTETVAEPKEKNSAAVIIIISVIFAAVISAAAFAVIKIRKKRKTNSGQGEKA